MSPLRLVYVFPWREADLRYVCRVPAFVADVLCRFNRAWDYATYLPCTLSGAPDCASRYCELHYMSAPVRDREAA